MGCSSCRSEAPPAHWWQFPPLRNALIASVATGAAFLLQFLWGMPSAVTASAYLAAMAVGGWYWMREGLEALYRERRIGIELLMLAATAGASALQLYEEAAALVVLYAFAEGVEELTFARTRHAIRALLELAPREARLVDQQGERLVPATTLRPGNRFAVRPGETLPTDGIIVEGRTTLDESAITGESTPVDKQPGDRVFAASINGAGALVVEATTAFEDNTLSRIIALVEKAQDRKGRSQQWLERFAGRYSPAVLATSGILLTLPLVTGSDWEAWAYRAVVLLVAAAPCALVISLPITLCAAIGSAGRQGILVKGGAALEHLGLARVVAFDKTGTLTTGRPTVTELVPVDAAADEVLALACALEAHSEHPLGRAIVAHGQASGIDIPRAEGFRALPGIGVEGVVEGKQWRVVRADTMDTLDAGTRLRVETLQKEGLTVVAVTRPAAALAGLIALGDEVRPEAPQAVRELQTLGLHTVMLTGDNPGAAARVAARTGIREVHSALSPEQKTSVIEALEARYGVTVMVGDGINDAPALAAAHCGIAMGAAGSDAAIEAADVALMADDMMKVVQALRLARRARRISLQNIVVGLSVLAVLIPQALTGKLGVALAVAVHEASELGAVANGLRVRSRG